MGDIPDDSTLPESDLETNLLLNESAKVKPRRFLALDLMRGFIMVVMAWDHSKDILADVKMHGQEAWSGEPPDWRHSFSFLFARIVSDICAPGFFFSMGMGITFFSLSRMRRGWSYKTVLKHYAERSLVLVILEKFANLGFFMQTLFGLMRGLDVTNRFSDQVFTLKDLPQILFLALFGYYAVLTTLAMAMFLSAFLFLIPMKSFNEKYERGESKLSAEFIGWLIFLLSFAISNSIIVYYQHGDPTETGVVFPEIEAPAETFLEFVVRIFLVPGPGAGGTKFSYPVIPWMGLTGLGMGFAFTAKRNYDAFIDRMGKLGVVFLIAFFLIRYFGGWFGNLRGYPRGDGTEGDIVSPLIEFFYTSKYPPSFAYALWTMGVNFLLIYAFSHPSVDKLLESDSKESRTLIEKIKFRFLDLVHSLGTAPLFFYIIHLLLIGFLGSVLSIFYNRNGTFNVRNVLLVIPLWLFVVLSLYPACTKYGVFKGSQSPDSWWRML